MRDVPHDPDAPKPPTSEYQRALMDALVRKRYELTSRGETPIAIRLMPEELVTLRHYFELTTSLYPMDQVVVPSIMGMEILTEYEPVRLDSRFVLKRR